MGCVKYKAQDVVLAVRIPLFMRPCLNEMRKIKVLAVEVSASARRRRDSSRRFGRDFGHSCESRPQEDARQGAEPVQKMWMRVEKEENRTVTQ